MAETYRYDAVSHKFTGKERDFESGLDNFGARYDSSSMGRFMSGDPIGGDPSDPQSHNRYSYTRSNPVNLTDPSGLLPAPPDDFYWWIPAESGGDFTWAWYYYGGGGMNGDARLGRSGFASAASTDFAAGLQGYYAQVFGFLGMDSHGNAYRPSGLQTCISIDGNPVSCTFSGIWIPVQSASADGGNSSGNDVPIGLDIFHCPSVGGQPGCRQIWNGATNMVNAGAIYTGAGITLVVAAPVAVAGTVEGTAVINETVGPHLETWLGRFAWKMAYIKQFYAAPVLSTAWKTGKWLVKNAESAAAASSANGGIQY